MASIEAIFKNQINELDLFAIEKHDSFDINNDGYADNVHLGEIGDRKVCSFNIVSNEF